MRNKCLALVSILVILLSVSLSGCSKYTSSFIASIYIHSSDSDSASMRFDSFKGREVMKFKAPKNKKTTIHYKATLGEGTATVFYDDGTKNELFTIKEGESLEASFGEFEDTTIYVIFETDGKCKDGKVELELEEI